MHAGLVADGPPESFWGHLGGIITVYCDLEPEWTWLKSIRPFLFNLFCLWDHRFFFRVCGSFYRKETYIATNMAS